MDTLQKKKKNIARQKFFPFKIIKNKKKVFAEIERSIEKSG